VPIVSTGQITIVDVNDGLDAGLSANGVVLAADSAGAVASFATAETTLTIREAGVVSTAGWTIYVSATGGGISYRDSDDAADRTGTGAVNGLLTGTPGYVKVVALTQDLSHLDITAVKGTQTVVRRFSVAKARAGAGGSPGTRGTITTSRAITGTAWSDAEANTAISNAGGGTPIQGDVVTLYNTGASFSATRVRSSGGTWSPLTAFFGGDVIVDNTLAASKIVANSITAGQIATGAISAAQIAAGAITATKLAANSIAVGTAAIQNGAIVNAMIGSAAIDSAKIADAAITTAKIGDAQITNAKIANLDAAKINTGTLDANRIAANSITASQINSNGLTIRDNSGNILFGVSNNIDSSRVNAASGWLNSNISIGSDGALSGAGGGQVSSTGLGITGLTLINDANCTQRGDTIQKVSGDGGWNAGMRSREAYSGGAFASVTTPSLNINAMFGLNSASATSSYTDIDYAIHFDSVGRVFVYEEGANKGQYGNWSSGQTYTVQYDGTTVKYMRDGSVFHQRALTQIAPLFFDSSIATVGGQLLGVRFGPLSKTKGQNLLDTRTWVYGSSSAPAGFPQNATSSGGANYIEHDTLPDGSRGLLWRARSGSATTENPEGGWDSDVFAIDHTKLYRFTVWIRCFGGNSSGNIYLGPGGSTVNDIGGGANGNPYFFAQGRSSLIGGEWYLLAGYVLPSGYSGGQQNISGLYRATTGQRVNAGTDFRWITGQTTSHHRTYQFYTNQANNYQDFFDPRVELCDGTEPSLGELLAMGSPSARNQINASNASTYIASAAIGDAQIANTIQSTNYSGSAGWQINKGGTATFNQVSVRGEVNGGAYTGYAWPAVNNYGFHLGPNGLLLGNANNNRYLQVTNTGDIYAPGFTIIAGAGTLTDITITRPTAVASGTFYPSANNVFVYSGGTGGGKGYPGTPAGWTPGVVSFEIDTGYDSPEALNDVRKGALTGNALVASTTYWSSTAPGGNKLYRIHAEVAVYAAIDHYTSGTSGPAGGRLYARIAVTLPRDIFGSVYQVRIDAIQWQVMRVK